MSDRLCVESAARMRVTFSYDQVLRCTSPGGSCDPPQEAELFKYLEETGATSWECIPYTTVCTLKCKSPEMHFSPAKLQNLHSLANATIQSIDEELIKHGSMFVVFKVYGDLLFYTSGVYKHVTGSFMGYTAMRLIGFGKTPATGEEYWIARSNWGNTYGQKGDVYIAKGNNGVDFEQGIYAFGVGW